MDSHNHHYLKLSWEGRILIISISNPPHNYLPSAVFEEFGFIRDLLLTPEVSAAVITGNGHVFSKGADVLELKSGFSAANEASLRLGNDILSSFSALGKPVIAAIDGPCLGAGLELALACHIRICSEKARIGLPELSIGLIPGLGGIQRLIRTIGEAKALELILLGDIISASRALELNLVNRVYPKADFLPKVLIFTKTLLSARQETIRTVLELSSLCRAENETENIRRAADAFARLVPRTEG